MKEAGKPRGEGDWDPTSKENEQAPTEKNILGEICNLSFVRRGQGNTGKKAGN